MKNFKEYLLDKKCTLPQSIYLPKKAEAVSVYDTEKGLKLLALVSSIELETDLRTFKICTVDENIYMDNIRYIGSFTSITGLKHVIEVI
jgi:hypothetical protein